MELLDPQLTNQIRAFATSLAIGLLMGLERQRRSDAKAGLRTFALVSLLGTLAALIADHFANGWILAVGLAVVGTMMIIAVTTDPNDDHDPGTTSVVALMVSYCLGAAVWFGYGTLAVMLGIASTALLYFKAELHGFTESLSSRDLISILQFAVLSFVILPILPDHDFGPYGALNPHQIWWMVVLISGVSLAGYAALRIAGGRHGAALVGFFGGLVSSTATTMIFARHTRTEAELARTATLVILVANLVLMLRLELIATVVAPAISLPLAAVLGTGFVLGLGFTLYGWRTLTARASLPIPEVSNPTEIRVALTFGLVYGLILLAAAWLEDLIGNRGVYAVALASGLTDVDAITLSTLRLYTLGKLDANATVTTIALANLSNLAFKSGLIVVIGGGILARRVLPGLAAIALGLVMALIFFT